MCYVLLLITGILFLLLAPYNRNRNIRFHAFQSIFLHIAFILIWMLSVSLQWVSFFLSPLVSLAFISVWIVMIVKTYQGRKIVLPLIGPLAEQQA